MKLKIDTATRRHAFFVLLAAGMLLFQVNLFAQDSTAVVEETAIPGKAKSVKNTFQSVWITDNQTTMVPIKGTMEMDIMHRFGTVKKGYEDFWGFFAPSNIRLGVSYVPINKLNLGVGLTKRNMLLDVNAKYALITQTPGKYPVSVSFYTNAAYDTRKDPGHAIFKYRSQKLSYFNQLLIARKLTSKLTVQVAPSVSHQNFVNGYYTKNDSTGQTKFREMKFDHFAIAFSARYKITAVSALMINYDQAITKHATSNPNPNLSFGIEMTTSSHSFQFFFSNYFNLSPQQNNLYNKNSPFAYTDFDGTKVKGGNFLIGFNITRLWNY